MPLLKLHCAHLKPPQNGGARCSIVILGSVLEMRRPGLRLTFHQEPFMVHLQPMRILW